MSRGLKAVSALAPVGAVGLIGFLLFTRADRCSHAIATVPAWVIVGATMATCSPWP